jgi:hypothetical protein
MRFRSILPLAVVALVAAALLVPAGASAASRYRVGIGDQNVSVFSDPNFQALKLKRIRYIVPWDWNSSQAQTDEVTTFVNTARLAGFEPFITFTAHRGCWTGKRYSKRKTCKAPSNSRYLKKFKAFRKAFPSVKVFAPWNEVNHVSQPTYKSPKRAAGYYNTLKRNCRGCKVVAADLLDTGTMSRYLKQFKRYAKGTPKIWGLHNYSDVNRKRTTKTLELLRQVRGEVWLTETGGIVSFTKSFPRSTTRAANRTKYMFTLSDKYSRKRKGLRSRITRIYPYQYSGVDRNMRFDAGLVDTHGKPRKAYKVFKSKVRSRSK